MAKPGMRTFPELLALGLENIDDDNAQMALASRIGVSQAAISKWLSGTRTPRRAAWRPIAEALGVTLAEVAAAIGMTPIDAPAPDDSQGHGGTEGWPAWLEEKFVGSQEDTAQAISQLARAFENLRKETRRELKKMSQRIDDVAGERLA